MNNEEIEKLKKAAFKLAEMAKEEDGGTEWKSAIAAIEAFKPEPEPVIFEAWGNFYNGRIPCLYRDPEGAQSNAGEGASRVAVHLREVTPAPEWERWDEEKVSTLHGERNWKEAFTAVAVAHNAEMRRVTGTEGK